MNNSISASMYQRESEKAPSPIFLIDGEPCHLWLSQRLAKIEINTPEYFIDVDVKTLVTAQAWLINNDEMATAWNRITPSYVGLTTIVPLLICDSDVDFSCIVFVVEQEVSNDFIYWNRFGFSMDHSRNEVGGTVKWLQTSCKAIFRKTEYIDALKKFEAICSEEWV
jgi:hypothetical protein